MHDLAVPTVQRAPSRSSTVNTVKRRRAAADARDPNNSNHQNCILVTLFIGKRYHRYDVWITVVT